MLRKKHFPFVLIAILFSTVLLHAQTSCSVSATKMNVFYAGVDNPIKVDAPGADISRLVVMVSGCNSSISGSKGEYIVKADTPGEVTVTVSEMQVTGNKTLLTTKYRVKRIPDPVAYVGMIKGDGSWSQIEINAIGGVSAKLENFDFDCVITVQSFSLSLNRTGTWITYKSNSPGLTQEMKQALAAARFGEKIIFSDVTVKMPDAGIRKIPGVVITVR